MGIWTGFEKGSGGRYVWDEKQSTAVKVSDEATDPNAGVNGPVYCPDTGYFDIALNKFFSSKTEKKKYMREHGLQMHSGSKKQTEGNAGKTYYFIPGMKRTNRYHNYR